jgi:DNA methyltransferase 1-associated protein 1
MDAVDILGVAPRSEFRPRQRERPPQDTSAIKLKGLQREVFHLTGRSHDEAAKPDTPPAQRFGKKHNTLQRKKVHWEFAGFMNSARTDGLMLRHWQVLPREARGGLGGGILCTPLTRASGIFLWCCLPDPACVRAPDSCARVWQKKGIKWEDYPFARFNKKVQLLSYNDEEYDKLLRSDDWTREQTDALMLLVQRFHLNFTLVQDRWQGLGSVDALKDRFYEIQRKLHVSRKLPPLPDDNPMLSKPFNRQWEEDRKRAVLVAMQRTKVSSARVVVVWQLG